MNILLYNSSARGAGQFSRSLKLAQIIVDSFGEARVVILVGNSMTDRALPNRIEVVALPQIRKSQEGVLMAGASDIVGPHEHERQLSNALALRKRIIRQTVKTFDPDLILVDSRPAGLNSELTGLLGHHSRTASRKLVLMLRDIVDDPRLVRRRWASDGTYGLIADVYDKVIVFGNEVTFDTVEQYHLSDVRTKVRYMGYLGNPAVTQMQLGSTSPGRTPNSVLVTVGGGYDGAGIVEAACEYISKGTRQAEQLAFRIVLGGNSTLSVSGLLARYGGSLRNTLVLRHVANLDALIAAAQVVVSMCGYNTLFELVQRQKRIVAIPRAHSGREQLLRADIVRHAYDGIWVLPENDLTPDTFGQFVHKALAAPAPRVRLEMPGEMNFISFLKEEMRGAR